MVERKKPKKTQSCSLTIKRTDRCRNCSIAGMTGLDFEDWKKKMSLFVITAILIDFDWEEHLVWLTTKNSSLVCTRKSIKREPTQAAGFFLFFLWKEKTNKINSNICLFISLSPRVILRVDEKKNTAANYAPVAADGVLFRSYWPRNQPPPARRACHAMLQESPPGDEHVVVAFVRAVACESKIIHCLEFG